MKAKYAKIIREGIMLSRLHADVMDVVMRYHMSQREMASIIAVVGISTPKHPLALRAYIHEVESRFADIQRSTEKLKRDIETNLRKPFVRKPSDTPPVPRNAEPPKPAPKIADGFHD